MATSLKIDQELKVRIQHLAELQHRSAHWIMLEAIREYVKQQEIRENFKQEALASWVEYQETGEHLTSKEVCAWLDTWGKDNEEEDPPPCHE